MLYLRCGRVISFQPRDAFLITLMISLSLMAVNYVPAAEAQQLSTSPTSLDYEKILQSAENLKKAEPDKSFSLANFVYDSAKKLGYQEFEAKSLVALGRVSKERKEFRKANNYFGQALTLGRQLKNREIIINSLYNIGDVLRFLKKFEEAHESADKGLIIAEEILNHALIYRGYNIHGNIYKSSKSYEQALASYSRSLEYAQKHKLEKYIVRAHRNIAKTYTKLDNVEASISHNLKALEVTERDSNADKAEVAKHLESIVKDQRKLGQYAPAVQNARRALSIYRKLKNTEGIKNILLGLTISYRKLGFYDSSLEYASELLTISENQTDINGIASANNQIALIYGHLEQHQDAREFYDKTISIPKNTIENKYRAVALRGIASTLHKHQKDREALDYANEAKALYQIVEDISGLESTNRLIGQIHHDLHNVDASLEAFEEALFQSRKTGARWSEASNLIHMGLVLVDKQPEKAKKIITEGINIAESLSTKSLIVDGLQALMLVEQKMGNHKKAFQYLNQQYQLSRELNKEDIKKRIADLKIIREVNEKEQIIESLERKSKIDALELDRQSAELKIATKENTISKLRLERERIFRILLIFLTILTLLVLAELYGRFRYSRSMQLALHQKNIQIESKNQTLEDLNATKDRFLSIVAHDLRGPISALTTLTGLLKDQLRNFSIDQLQDHANSLHEASQQTLNLVNELLEWAMTQVRNTDPIPRNHSVITLCSSPIKSIEASAKAKKIHINCSIDESLTIFADQNMIKTVVRNILSNAIKFTPRSGIVEIYTEENEKSVTIHIKDSGVGISPENIPYLFDIDKKISELGTDGEKGSGFGLTLCKEFVEKNGGKIKVTSQLNQGTNFEFSIPRPSA